MLFHYQKCPNNHIDPYSNITKNNTVPSIRRIHNILFSYVCCALLTIFSSWKLETNNDDVPFSMILSRIIALLVPRCLCASGFNRPVIVAVVVVVVMVELG